MIVLPFIAPIKPCLLVNLKVSSSNNWCQGNTAHSGLYEWSLILIALILKIKKHSDWSATKDLTVCKVPPRILDCAKDIKF